MGLKKTKRVTVYLDDYQYTYLVALAERENVSMSKLLAELPRVYIRQDEMPGFKYNFRSGGWIKCGHTIYGK